jgi:hypothetical protein
MHNIEGRMGIFPNMTSKARLIAEGVFLRVKKGL